MAAVLGALLATPAAAETVVSCPFSPSTGDSTNSEGFYLSGYPGTNLDQVTMQFGSSTAGSYTFTLTARLGAFDGPVIGTKTVPVSLPSGNPTTPVTFDFGAAAVAPGSTITFYPTKTGPAQAFFNTGTGPCPGVTETQNITPPLSTFRRDSVGLTVTQVPAEPGPATTTTGQRAAALKKCKKKHSQKKRKKCRKRAKRLPV